MKIFFSLVTAIIAIILALAFGIIELLNKYAPLLIFLSLIYYFFL